MVDELKKARIGNNNIALLMKPQKRIEQSK